MAGRIPPFSVTVSLRNLFPFASFVGCADIRVASASDRSGECGPHKLFAAIPGTRVDGIHFVTEAIERGASALLVERPLANVSVPQCIVPNVRQAYAELCAALTGYPSRRLGIAGVTGTNGKTTVTWLIRSILESAGKQAGLIGTVEYSDGIDCQPSELTTPDSGTLSRWLARMVQRRTTHAAIEVSSHALDQERTSGILLDVAIVTNITQDHYDYHGNHETYRKTKARIAERCKKGGLVVLNADDPACISLMEQAGSSTQVRTYGVDQPADLSATILEESLAGTHFLLSAGTEQQDVRTSLVGRHNVSNCLAAAAAALHFGLSLKEIALGIESLSAIPGRLERIDCGQAFDVFVDYAHTDDALRRVVHTLKQLTPGRVICVFGAGGDRDRSKRPLLGQAAAEADLAVVTSDNPRTEHPEDIIRDILPGLTDTEQQPWVEVDRARAIQRAINEADPGDCILVAGKGHETEQIIGTERFAFDDRAVVREALLRKTLAVPIEQGRIRA